MTYTKSNFIMRNVNDTFYNIDETGVKKMQLSLDYIRERRKSLNLTQKEMAEKLNLSSGAHYGKFENGVFKLKAEMLPALAKLLKCKIANFFI